MEEEVKIKLDSVLKRKTENEALETRKALAVAEAAQQQDAKKAAARARWEKSLDEIGGAISHINERIRQADLELFLEDRKDRSDGPAIAQVAVGLRERGEETKKRLVFNVNAFGLVQLVNLIPHTGSKLADFNIADVDISRYEAVLVEFLDQCVPTKQAS